MNVVLAIILIVVALIIGAAIGIAVGSAYRKKVAEAEIGSDIDALVDLKADITHRIKQINCPEYQLVLELRYLCFKSWEEIALQMGYDVRHVFRLHGEALKAISDLE